VYDIINVLLAVGLISQDRKTIRWLGYPNTEENATEEEKLLKEREAILFDIEMARAELATMYDDIRLFSTLCNANKEVVYHDEQLHLPFLAITTQQDHTAISLNEDDTECWIELPEPFQIQDDVEYLRSVFR